jgi:hypothetical protein
MKLIEIQKELDHWRVELELPQAPRDIREARALMEGAVGEVCEEAGVHGKRVIVRLCPIGLREKYAEQLVGLWLKETFE